MMRVYLTLLLACMMVVLTDGARAEGLSLLDHDMRVYVGEASGVEHPDFDDSDWPVQPVLEPGGWPARGADAFDHVLWQRITFEGSDLPDLSNPALCLGVLAGTVVYLNGIEIGRLSALDAPFGGHWQTQLKALPQVYVIPNDLLLHDGINVIAMRSVRTSVELSGLIDGPLSITEVSEALKTASPKTALFVFVGTFLPVICLLSTLAVGVLWTLAPRGTGLGWLFLAHVLITPFLLGGSSLMLYLGSPVPLYIYPYLTILVGSLALAPILEFAAIVLKTRITWPVRVLQIATVLIAFIPNFNEELIFANSTNEDLIWTILAILVYVVLTVWSVQALRRGLSAALVFLIGTASVWILLLMSIANMEHWFFANLGLSSTDISTPVFVVCIAWAGMARAFGDSRERLAAAQSDVLRAQEAERRRVAHDLHDGVGQWLSAIKLNLQMLQGRYQGTDDEGRLSEVVDHLDEAILDTRRIAHDLSPAMIEKKGLAAAILSHADLVTKRSNVTVSVDAGDIPDLSPTTQGHLYRVFQEAVQNAIRHGGARNILVQLQPAAQGFELSVQDDGAGFDPDTAEGGIGLTSMRQRAELIGAEIRIDSAPGQGTTLMVRRSRRSRRPEI
ncbi:MAG: ATP-binding protein [Paracoccaceae bacterium]